MNRQAAIEAILWIKIKVHMSLQFDDHKEEPETVELASKNLTEAVQGDAYAQTLTARLAELVRDGYLAKDPSPWNYHEELFKNADALHDHITKLPD